MNERHEMDDQDLYLEPKRHIPWQWWLIAGVVGLLLLGAGRLAVALGAGQFPGKPQPEARPTMTLVPTFTPHPTSTAVPPAITLSTRPWTDDRAPVGLVEVTLSLPAGARVSHQPPPGFRYWAGDLVQTRQGFAWSPSGSPTTRQGQSGAGGASGGEVRWYLFREAGTTVPVTLEVTVGGQTLAVTLQAAAPATTSVPLE
jgi:hypothetical protein